MITKELLFIPGWDKRGPLGANYGVHSPHLLWLLRGPNGAVVWEINTNWHPDYIQSEWRVKHIAPPPHQPSSWGLAVHAPLPQYDNHDPNHDNCEWLGGRKCFATYTCLAFDDKFVQRVFHEGPELVWSKLQEYYDNIKTIAPVIPQEALDHALG